MKNMLILLVSMLLPLVSSCGEKPTIEPTIEPTLEPTLEPTIEESTSEIVYNYNESEYSQHLNAIKYSGLLRNDPLEDFILEQNYIYSKTHSIFQYSHTEESFYLCVYLHKDDLEFMEDYTSNRDNPMLSGLVGPVSYPITQYNLFKGIDASYLTMNVFKHDYNVKNMYPNYAFKDALWLEIPVSEEIPTEIGEYKLSVVSELAYFNFFDLDKNFLGTKAYLMDCMRHKMFNNNQPYSDMELRLYDAVKLNFDKKKYYLSSVNYSIEPLFVDMLVERRIQAIEIEEIDNVEYICLHTGNNFENLLKKYDLISKNEIEYYIKLEDIIDFIKTEIYK